MSLPLPTPENWEWLKQKLEEARAFPSGLFSSTRMYEWLREEVAQHRPELQDYVLAYGQALLTEPGEMLESDWRSFSEPDRIFAAGDLVGGRYSVRRFLGAGGMGEVYEVDDCQLAGRNSIALKTIRADISGSDADSRFEREVRVALRVAHPNVCRVFDVGRHGSTRGRLFLTMEMLHGQLLSDRLRPKPGIPAGSGMTEETETRTMVQPLAPQVMTEAEALPIIRQMASGLGAIHSLGIVHRDFKPANVVLVPEADGSVRAVIMDFGLARPSSAAPDEDVTRAGGIPGTPAYMDPDQTQSSVPAPVVDVYALGVTMHEMLTGKRYVAGQPFDVLQRAGLSRKLRNIVIRCLASTRVKRYQDANQVLAALDVPAWHSYAKVLFTAAVAAVALLGLVYAFTLRHPEPPQDARIAFAQGVKSYFSQAPYMAAIHLQEAVKISPDYAEAHARLALAWLEAGMKGKAREAALAANAPDLIRRVDARTRKFCEAVEYRVLAQHAKATAIFEELAASAAPEDRMFARFDLGREYEDSAQRLKGRAIWQEYASQSPYALSKLGMFEQDPAKHLEMLRKIAGLYRENHNIEGETHALYVMGLVLWSNDTPQATQIFNTVIQRAQLSHDVYEEAEANLRLATLLTTTSADMNSVEVYAKRGLQLARDGGVEMALARGFDTLASAALFRKEYDKALEYGGESYRLAVAAQDEQMINDARTLLGYLKTTQGDFAEAEKDFDALTRFHAKRGLYKRAAGTAVQLSAALREQGKVEAGLTALAQAKEYCLHAGEDMPPCQVLVFGTQAIFESQAGRYADAVRTNRYAIDLAHNSNIDNMSWYQRDNLASDLAETGAYEAAEAELRALPDAGNWPTVKALRRIQLSYHAKSASADPARIRSLQGALTSGDGRAVAQNILIAVQARKTDGSTLEKWLPSLPPLPAGTSRGERLSYRLTLAEAWLKSKKRPEALAALGPFTDFEIHPLHAWRAALIEAEAAPAEEQQKWLAVATAQWNRLESLAGKDIADRIRTRRSDLARYFAVQKTPGRNSQ